MILIVDLLHCGPCNQKKRIKERIVVRRLPNARGGVGCVLLADIDVLATLLPLDCGALSVRRPRCFQVQPDCSTTSSSSGGSGGGGGGCTASGVAGASTVHSPAAAIVLTRRGSSGGGSGSGGGGGGGVAKDNQERRAKLLADLGDGTVLVVWASTGAEEVRLLARATRAAHRRVMSPRVPFDTVGFVPCIRCYLVRVLYMARDTR